MKLGAGHIPKIPEHYFPATYCSFFPFLFHAHLFMQFSSFQLLITGFSNSPSLNTPKLFLFMAFGCWKLNPRHVSRKRSQFLQRILCSINMSPLNKWFRSPRRIICSNFWSLRLQKVITAYMHQILH